jgi:hypothetical protein
MPFCPQDRTVKDVSILEAGFREGVIMKNGTNLHSEFSTQNYWRGQHVETGIT